MAIGVGTWSLYQSARPLLKSAGIDVGSDTFKAKLLSDSYTPDLLTHTQLSDVSAYTLGTDQTLSISAVTTGAWTTVSIGSPVSWSGPVSPRYIVIYDYTHANGALFAIGDFGAVQSIPSGSTLTLEDV